MYLNQEKWDFLNAELMANSTRGAFQRAGIYTGRATGQQREQLRERLQILLTSYAKAYDSHISDETHNKNIKDLADTLSREFGDIVGKGRFRIGIAQKVLNLYLKYLWCADKIGPPPHCPFDSRVISWLPQQSMPRKMSWTSLDRMKDYELLVESARQKAKEEGYSSISEWELIRWNKSRRRHIHGVIASSEPTRNSSLI